MKFNFKKITPIIASAILVGATLGIGFATATYPDPFVVGSTADVNVIYGVDAKAIDMEAVSLFTGDLQAALPGAAGAVTTMAGESVNLATSATTLYCNSSIEAARSALTDSDLPTVLADGTVKDDSGTEYDYTQSIELGAGATKVIATYSRSGTTFDDPDMHIQLTTADANPFYALDIAFTKSLNVSHSDVQGNDISILGSEWTIGASSTCSNLYLYGAGTKQSLQEGETVDVEVGGVDYVISNDGVSDSNTTHITVNDLSKKCKEGSTYKFGDLEVYVKTVYYLPKEGQVSSVELSLGSSRLLIKNNSKVKLGTDETSIKGTYSLITCDTAGHTGKISALKINITGPNSKGDQVRLGESFEDPVFGGLKFEFSSVTPALDDESRETILVETSGDTGASVTFNSALADEQTFEYAYGRVRPLLADSGNKTIHVIEGEIADEDEYIIVNSGDYGRILEVDSIDVSGESADSVTFTDALDSSKSWKVDLGTDGNGTLSTDGQTYKVSADPTHVVITWGSGAGYGIDDFVSTNNSINITTANITGVITVFPRIKLDSDAWLILATKVRLENKSVIYLPGEESSSPTAKGINSDTAGYFDAATKIGNVSVGGIKWALNWTNKTADITGVWTGSDTLVHFESVEGPAIILLEEKKDGDSDGDAIIIPGGVEGVTTSKRAIETPYFTDKSISALVAWTSDTYVSSGVDRYGTYLEYDTHDQNKATIKYPDDQMTVDIFAAETAAVASTSAQAAVLLGDVILTDSEAEAASPTTNLIVVGGTAVNKVSAKLLDVTYPTKGAAWTTASGVGEDEAIIKTYTSPYAPTKSAMLVAGWAGKDTMAAAKALIKDKKEGTLSVATEESYTWKEEATE